MRYLGLDLGITALSRACLTDEAGNILVEKKFRLTRSDLEDLGCIAMEGLSEGGRLVVVMEPTSSSWIAPAAFFASIGAKVHVVPPEQSSDLRRYYTKHVKNDRLDAKLLARLPLLHPEGLHETNVPTGSLGTLKRTVARRARLVEEAARHRVRVSALLNWAMPGMYEILGDQLGKAAIAFLGRYGNPKAVVKLGKARLSALLIKTSKGHWREEKAEQILVVAKQAIALWDGLDGCDFDEVADDLAAEARLVKAIEAEIRELDKRAAVLLAEIDPQGIFLSMPGFAERTATTVAGRLGDISRFTNGAAVRCFIGMIPATNQSGQTETKPRLTKSGDRFLRTGIFMAAESGRQLDPQLAKIYFTQMVDKGNHHTKAVCAVATALATRLAAVLREGRPYVIRDVDGTEVTPDQARRIIASNYTVAAELRASRRQLTLAKRQRGRHLDGVRSKTLQPSPPEEMALRTNGKRASQLA